MDTKVVTVDRAEISVIRRIRSRADGTYSWKVIESGTKRGGSRRRVIASGSCSSFVNALLEGDREAEEHLDLILQAFPGPDPWWGLD